MRRHAIRYPYRTFKENADDEAYAFCSRLFRAQR